MHLLEHLAGLWSELHIGRIGTVFHFSFPFFFGEDVSRERIFRHLATGPRSLSHQHSVACERSWRFDYLHFLFFSQEAQAGKDDNAAAAR